MSNHAVRENGLFFMFLMENVSILPRQAPGCEQDETLNKVPFSAQRVSAPLWHLAALSRSNELAGS
jgi:hypothetical protein